MIKGPLQRCTDVIPLVIHQRDPARLLGSYDLWLGLFRQLQDIRGMPLPRRIRLTCPFKLLQGVRADRFQHSETRIVFVTGQHLHQMMVHEDRNPFGQ